MAGPAESAGCLVQDASGSANVGVFRPLCKPGAFHWGDVETEEIAGRGHDRALDRCGTGQTRPERHIRGEHQVDRAHPVSRLAQCPQHPGQIGRPAPAAGIETRQRKFHGFREIHGVHDDQVVVATPRCDEGALFQREGQDETVVVVGVFADQVHPPGGEPDSLRYGAHQFPVAGGQFLSDVHGSPSSSSPGSCWLGGGFPGGGDVPATGKHRPHAPKALFIRSVVCCW